VSRGYEARPAPTVTPQPRPKEAKNEPSSAPTRTTGSEKIIELENSYLKRQRTERIVDTKVEATVDNNTNNRWNKATVEASNTIGSKSFSVNVNYTIELTSTSTLGGFGIVGKTGTSVIQRVDEEQRRSTGSSTRSNIASEPRPVTFALLETEERLEVILY
jgi:hypothetical protein